MRKATGQYLPGMGVAGELERDPRAGGLLHVARLVVQKDDGQFLLFALQDIRDGFALLIAENACGVGPSGDDKPVLHRHGLVAQNPYVGPAEIVQRGLRDPLVPVAVVRGCQ